MILLGQSGWRFFDHLENANNPIEGWYWELSDNGRDTFDALLKGNQKIEIPVNWIGMRPMQGDCKREGIWEWRFYADKRQQRILGIFGSQRKHFIFLIGCYHKQNVYKPAQALETAIKRAKANRENGTNVIERFVKSNS